MVQRLPCAVVLAFAFFTTIPLAQAHQAKSDDLRSVMEFYRADVFVKKDGKSDSTIETRIRINNEEGRESDAIQNHTFNAASDKFEMIEARTENSDGVHKVSTKNIDIKTVGDFSRYFDSQKVAKVTFPQVKIGSKLYEKYKYSAIHAPHKNFWSWVFDFNDLLAENLSITVKSELPLHSWKNDPEGFLDIKITKQGAFHVAEVRLKRPFSQIVVREENPFIRPERRMRFTLTTNPNWNEFAQPAIQQYEKLLSSQLPASMAKIATAASKETTATAKINRVAASIAEDFRYFGDWRTREGGIIPRNLKTIDETRYGDCKDLSLTAVAILRTIGFKANVAWIERGAYVTRPTRESATIAHGYFNHAVVRAEFGKEVFWMDPTNPVAIGSLIPADIAGRPSFIVDRERPRMEVTPNLASGDAADRRYYSSVFGEDKTWSVTGKTTSAGRYAVRYATDSVYKPLETQKYDLIRSVTWGLKVSEPQITVPEKTRIAKDVELPFSFKVNRWTFRTSAGMGYPLSREFAVDRLTIDVSERHSDISLDEPGVLENIEELAGVKSVGNESINCDIRSPWINLSRNITDTESGVTVRDRVEIIEPVVPIEFIRTADFEEMQDQIKDCFMRASIILKPNPSAKLSVAKK